MAKLTTRSHAVQIDIGNGLFAIIDSDDFQLISPFRWRAKKDRHTAYARTTGKDGSTIFMHRLIIDAKQGEIVDHIDRNGLNNRRSNLRIVSHSHNTANTAIRSKHGYRGISFDPRCKSRPWQASVKLNGKNHKLGNYESKEAAALAHDIGSFGLHRDVVLLNFPGLFAALEASNG